MSSFIGGDPAYEATQFADVGPPSAGGSVPGLEARHAWFPSVNGFANVDDGPTDVLNYLWDWNGDRRRPMPDGIEPRSGQSAVGAVARLEKIGGLHSRPDFDDNRGNQTTRPGEYLLPSFARGRTITYEGTLRAGSLAALREQEALMRAAYSVTEGMMVVEYHPEYSDEEQLAFVYFARPTQLDIIDEQAEGATALYPHGRPFVLALRQHDPRYYLWNPEGDAGFSSAAGDVSGDPFTVTVAGTAPTDPVFVFDAPGTSVTIHNASAGWTMVIDGLPDLTGDTLTIDFGLRLAYKGAFAGDMTGKIDLSSTDAWDSGKYGLVAGDNVIDAESSEGSWTVLYRPATW